MLDQTLLGTALYNKANEFNEQQITADNIEQHRKDFWKGIAGVIIDHVKTNGVLKVPGTGLVAPSGGGPVTGNSITGKME
jgi:hypothetical protein